MQHTTFAPDPVEPPPATLGDRPDERGSFDDVVGINLRPVAAALALLFLLLGLAQALVGLGASRWLMTLLAFGAAAALGLVAAALRGRLFGRARTDQLGAGICGLVLLYSLLQLAILDDPDLSIHIALTLIVAASLLLSRRWLAVLCAAAYVGWLGLVLALVRPETVGEWRHFGLILAESTALAFAVQTIRYRLFQRISALRAADGRRQRELELALEQVRDSEVRTHTLLDAAFEGIAIHEAGYLIDVNRALAEMFGYGRDELLQRAIVDLVAPEDLAAAHQNVALGYGAPFTFRGRRRDGTSFPIEVSARALPYRGRMVRAVAVRDLSVQQAAEATIRRMAYFDSVTDLPNRRLFGERVRTILLEAERAESTVALLLLDLDRFKVINDTLGHSLGDRLLRTVADRLRSCVRSGDTVARMGGDEFMVLLPNVVSRDTVFALADRIDKALAAPMRIDEHDLVVRASIGIALYPDDGTDVETLLKHADTAMYRAKADAAGPIQFYSPTMRVSALNQLALEQQLRRGLQRGEFKLVYQPRVAVDTGAICGMEALVRWEHPERGLVSPAEFIPLAEDTGLIIPLGGWVLETACAQANAWHVGGHPGLRIAVNLSARQFQQADLAVQITEILCKTGLDPHTLELEITESTAMRDVDTTLGVLRTLKLMGIELSLDDFGTGYSSLSYLKRFPLDRLKLDRSFVSGVTTDPQDASIASGVIALAHNLGMSVTAEGVETEAQRGFLVAHGCDELQGYLLSKPLPPDAFLALLRATPQQVCLTPPRHVLAQ